jgi:decaprenylphospho-beta-D-ribofuranose 2-oxidase
MAGGVTGAAVLSAAARRVDRGAAPAALPVGAGGVVRRLAGWGRYPVVETELRRPERLADLVTLVRAGGSVVGRGLGRSYGDAALNGAGRTVLFERLDRLLSFDEATGVLECEAGVTLEDVLAVFAPRGWLPPVCPGTQHVTVGGAVACDVHGKSHHQDGTFGRHVLELQVVTAAGEAVRCSRDRHPDLFRATIGGMGLTAFIVEVKLRLQRMASPWIGVDYDRARDLDGALRLFADSDERYAYSVAWIDCLARGRSLGRAVLMRGNPLSAADAPQRRYDGGLAAGVPFELPGIALNPLTIRAFNTLYYRRHPAAARGVATHYRPFFFPLDGIRNWNRLYGRRGFLQYQLVVPVDGGREALVRILELARRASGSFLAVLKRFGAAPAEGLLSFPAAGYTLALDFPAGRSGLLPLLDELDEVVIRSGGRVYLAKDARLRAAAFRAMYPHLPAWLDTKRAWDPDGVFCSDLGRRLGLSS